MLLVTDLTAASFVDREFAEAGLMDLLAQEPALQLQLLDVGQPTAFNGSISKVSISDLTPPRLSKTDVAVTLVKPATDSKATESPPRHFRQPSRLSWNCMKLSSMPLVGFLCCATRRSCYRPNAALIA